MLDTKVLQFLSHNIVLISIQIKVKLFKVTPKAYPLLKETTKKCHLPRFCNYWTISPKFKFVINPGRKYTHMIQSSFKNDSNLKGCIKISLSHAKYMSVVICLLLILFDNNYVFADINDDEIWGCHAPYVRLFYSLFRYIFEYCFWIFKGINRCCTNDIYNVTSNRCEDNCWELEAKSRMNGNCSLRIFFSVEHWRFRTKKINIPEFGPLEDNAVSRCVTKYWDVGL